MLVLVIFACRFVGRGHELQARVRAVETFSRAGGKEGRSGVAGGGRIELDSGT